MHGDLLGRQSGEQNVALDRLEHQASIFGVHRPAASLQLAVDPLGNRQQQIDLFDQQLLQRQQTDQRLLLDLQERLTLERIRTLVGDQPPHMRQWVLRRISDLHQLLVDQADVRGVHLALDVVEERLVEVGEQVHVGGQVALGEFGAIEVDRKSVDVPSGEQEIKREISSKLQFEISTNGHPKFGFQVETFKDAIQVDGIGFQIETFKDAIQVDGIGFQIETFKDFDHLPDRVSEAGRGDAFDFDHLTLILPVAEEHALEHRATQAEQ